jgi:hypothetical protein
VKYATCSERTESDVKGKLVNYGTYTIYITFFDWVVFYLSVHGFYCVYCSIVYFESRCVL